MQLKNDDDISIVFDNKNFIIPFWFSKYIMRTNESLQEFDSQFNKAQLTRLECHGEWL